MNSYKNLLDVIEKSDIEISYYLEDVTVEQFKKDVLDIAKMNVDQEYLNHLIIALTMLIKE